MTRALLVRPMKRAPAAILVFGVGVLLACDRKSAERDVPVAPKETVDREPESEAKSATPKTAEESDATAPPRKVVQVLRSRDGAKIDVPDSEPSQALSASDGGELTLWSSEERRTLWVSRSWDNGAVDLWKFEGSVNNVLYFVDGVLEKRALAILREPVQDLVNRNIVRRGDHVAERMTEAWLVDAAKRVTVRPATGAEYPLVGKASKGSRWAVFVPSCDASDGVRAEERGCLLVGAPREVCEAYWVRTKSSPSWWIYPKDCDGTAPDYETMDRFETIE